MPRIVKFGSDPDVLSRHAGCLDTFADFSLVAVLIRSGVDVSPPVMLAIRSYLRINVSVAGLQCHFDGFANLVWLGLPGSEANTRQLRTGIQGEDGSAKW